METVISWFGIFSDFWSSGSWGEAAAGSLWTLNAIACAVVAVEALAMMHMSARRVNRLAFGLVALGAFAYFAGEIGGQYYVVAPVETFFHWAVVAAMGTTLAKRMGARQHA